jgi:hypothetical protein
VRFLVTRTEVTPVEFEHPKLFVPKQKPPESRIAMNGATDGRGAERPIKLAEAAESESSAAVLVPEIAKPAPTQIEKRSTSETEAPTVADVKATGTVEPLAPAEAPASLAPAELRKSVEVPAASEPARPAEVVPSAAQPTDTPADDIAKPAPTADPPRPLAPSRIKSADQPVKRTGQVAVFVSRKEKKIFVRQGMVPVFDMPIVIEEPDQPLGAHVFTALAVTDDGAGMRWNLMTIATDGTVQVEYRESRRRAKEPPKPIVHSKPPSTAAEALNRIQMPKEALDRISELLIPGSSLVVSDEGLGRETGRGTEFIVLTR